MKLKHLFFLVLLTFSCNSPDSDLLEIDPRDWVENKITLAEIADDIIYIPLDNHYPVIARLGQITDNSIFLFTRDGILAFNRDGKMARKIGANGRGPGEYIYGMSFTVNNKTETVYVKDKGFIIKVYSKNGNFLRSIPLPKSEDGFDFDEINFFNSNLFVSQSINMGHAKYNWIIIDTLGNIIKKKENSIPTFPGSTGAQGGTYKFEDKISYWNWYDDTVYCVSPDLNYKASFVFNLGEQRLPRSRFESPIPSEYMKQMSKYVIHGDMFETNRFLVLDYRYDKNAIALIDKKSKKIYMNYHIPDGNRPLVCGITNDIDGGIMFRLSCNSYFVENGKEYLAGLIEPLALKIHVASEAFKNSTPKYTEKKKEFEKLANSLKEIDNPVLMLVKLKK